MRWKKYTAKKRSRKMIAQNMRTSVPIPHEYLLHKTDKAALDGLKKLPFFDTLCGKFIECFNERTWHIVNTSSKIRVTDKQCSRVYRMAESISKKLGIVMPDLYIEMNREPNAYTYGNKKVFVTLTSGLLECLADDELYAVLAHECGHIACHHVLYHTMGTLILGGGELGASFLENSLLAKLITTPLKMAFFNWLRCSELSADRAAVACCNGAKPVVTAMMRLAGGSAHFDKDLDVRLFVEQAAEYKGSIEQGKSNKVVEYLMNWKGTHPLLAVRAYKAQAWERSDEYKVLVEQSE